MNSSRFSHNSSPVINLDGSSPVVSRSLDLVRFDFAANPQPRCPVVLLLDSSSSMAGQPIQELQEAMGQFYHEMGSDPISRLSVELCLIPFGTDVKVIRGFEPVIDSIKRPRPWLEAGGNTPMGSGITLGLDEIKTRRRFYKQQCLSAYKPWLVLFTDGQPNDEWQAPAARARDMAARGQLLFFGVGIGDGVDMHMLSSILPSDNPPHKLQGLRFNEFFRWLNDSLKVVTSGSTAQQRQIPNPDEYDWAM